MKKEKKGMHCHLKGTASLSKRGRMAIKKKKKRKRLDGLRLQNAHIAPK